MTTNVQVARAAALALGELGDAASAQALIKAEADKIGWDVIGQALVACAQRLASDGDKESARKVYDALYKRSATVGIRMAALRGLAVCGSDEAIVTAMLDEDAHVQTLGMQLLRESLGPEQTEEKIANWFQHGLAQSTDVGRRSVILSRLPQAPSVFDTEARDRCHEAGRDGP